MTKEIEVKILNIDLPEMVEKVKALGAKKSEQGLVKVKAYDQHDNSLRDNDSFVRVREIAGRTEVVFKGPITDPEVTTREEIEFHTDTFERPCTLFERMGMKLFADHEKYRATYKFDGAKIEFDKYPEIPWFVEVEAPTREKVQEIIEKLGFTLDNKDVLGRGFTKVYGHKYKFEKFVKDPDYDHLFD